MESFFDFTITPFYYIGMAVWKIMLILIGVTAGETPQAFSEGTWNYITQSLYPLFLAIGSTLLNVFFLIGYLRSVSNLRDGMTLEMFIELCIKVALGNLVIQSIIPIMEQIFNLAGGISKLLIAGTDNPFVQSDMDGGAIFFYAVFGIIYFAVCLVSSVTIFLTVYGRYLQLYLLVLSAPIAFRIMITPKLQLVLNGHIRYGRIPWNRGQRSLFSVTYLHLKVMEHLMCMRMSKRS